MDVMALAESPGNTSIYILMQNHKHNISRKIKRKVIFIKNSETSALPTLA